MPTKTRFKAASCGAGLWEEQITQEDINAMRELAEMKGNISAAQVREMIDTYNRVTGSNEQYTSCSSCIELIQKKMSAIVSHDYEKEVKERTKNVAHQKKV